MFKTHSLNQMRLAKDKDVYRDFNNPDDAGNPDPFLVDIKYFENKS